MSDSSQAGTATTKGSPPAVSRRIATMPRSAIREIMALAADREDVIHLELGEPDSLTPETIIEEAFAATRAGATRYTPNAGTAKLRELVAARAGRRQGREIRPAEVVVTTGAIGALFTAIALAADAGDEVLVPDPGWPNYVSICHLLGVRAVRYRLEPEAGFLPDPAALAALVTPRTRAIVINSPANPNGTVFPAETMAALGALATERGLFLISDEVYEDLVFEGRHEPAGAHAPIDRVLTVSGVSKSFAMTGWRIGWLIVPSELADAAASLQEPVTSCPAAPSQAAAIAALSAPEDVVAELRDTYRRRRDILLDVLGGTDLLAQVPDGAFYALVDIRSSGLGSVAFARRLLEETGVATVPGETFGPSCDGYVRIAFTTTDAELRRGLMLLRDNLLSRLSTAE